MSIADLEQRILQVLTSKHYKPLKPKALAGKIGVDRPGYAEFRRALKNLFRQGRAQLGKNSTVRVPEPHGTATGLFRRLPSGAGIVMPHKHDAAGTYEILIPADHTHDAANGDEVLVRVVRKPNRTYATAMGEIMEVLERATSQFVGTYFERDRQGYVRVAGTVFSHSVWVGDPGSKGAKPEDQVVIEMLRFPRVGERGEAVITEVLGPAGEPGVDALTIIRTFGLPEAFREEALQEARVASQQFDENFLGTRRDFTADCIITIDPVDARDFDDAISLVRDDQRGHWHLGVHIADVTHFVPPGGPLDQEARKRGTSVYLPGRVIPMLPELISNGLASLQQDRVRYVKTALIEFGLRGERISYRFVEGAIRVKRRFTYEQVQAFLDDPTHIEVEEEIRDLLERMRELAMILRKRRFHRGALELEMPEPVLDYDTAGRVVGAHFATHDVSHQIIEEFMLAANEAVADFFREEGLDTLRRIHPPPEPRSLEDFAEFARMLGYNVQHATSRFELQRLLRESIQRGEAPAVHFAFLRSLKQAVYSPEPEEHYALASNDYLHFTSPIRRYPDLIVHRMLGQWLRKKRPAGNLDELKALASHCSRTERRAEKAERELVKLKMLMFLSEQIGMQAPAIITGVADYGFYTQLERFPIEGLVHISTLHDDFYDYDEAAHTLHGTRHRRQYRLGDKVDVEVVRVDVQRRQLDLRVLDQPTQPVHVRRPRKGGRRRRG